MVASSENCALTLFVMTEKGYEFLRGTVEEFGAIIQQVVVGSDKSLQKDFEEEIIALCRQYGILCTRRVDFGRISTPYALAISWRWLIDHPQNQLIIFHDSLLPRYRGFAPLVNALINGEAEVGVSAIFGASDFDVGDVIAQASVPVSYPIRIAEAIALVNECYLACGRKVLAELKGGRALQGVPQNEAEASFSVWRDEADYAIDWRQPAGRIRRLVDAVGYPYKGACTTLDGQLLRILAAEELPDVKVENRDCGKVLFVLEGLPVVICGTGLLKITEAMLERPAGGMESMLPLPRFRSRFGS